MRRIGVLGLLLLGMSACGSESDEAGPPSAPSPAPAPDRPGPANSAPVLSRAEITPRDPIGGDELRVEFDVNDPDGDRVDLRIDWYVNRELYREDSGGTLDTSRLRVRSEIYAIVNASDGQTEALSQTAAVFLGNSPPSVSAIILRPEKPTAVQTLIAEATVVDRERDEYEVKFEWILNGTPVPGEQGATLQPGKAKRGDKVSVRAFATDPQQGPTFQSEPIEIGNAQPEIQSDPSTTLAGPMLYRYEIRATDPDGDRPLRYRLVEGPDDMSVDLVSGLVEWQIPDNVSGTIPIEVAVQDPFGGEATQSYTLELNWEDAPKTKTVSESAEESDDPAELDDSVTPEEE